MTKKSKTAALRPYLATDAPILAAIFRASIEDLTAEDYDEDQRNAWAALADDEAAFAARIGGLLTIVATIDGAPVAFAALKTNDTIDLLYVHPAVARQGIGTMLCYALEKLATARGTTRLSVEASDTAQDFFKKRGFIPLRRNIVPVDGEWLANTSMEKRFGAGR
jgi:putative acetyltransferase